MVKYKGASQLIDPKDEISYFLFLIWCGLGSTFGFGIYYFLIGVEPMVKVCLIAFTCFIFIFWLFSREILLIILFRMSILVTFSAFYFQVYFTGGVQSDSLTVFTTLPLFGFFYKPKIDRYVLAILAFLCMISMAILSKNGFTEQHVQPQFASMNSLIVSLFLLFIIIYFTLIFWRSIKQKNKKILRSIEEINSTTERLIQSEKMASLGVMSAGVAHEINNPLNFILGGVTDVRKQLEENELLNDDLEESFSLIHHGIDRVTGIIRSLNHFSRSNERNDAVCQIHQILKNCLVMLQYSLKGRIEIETHFDAEELLISGNEGKLHQVFLNILSNAMQAINDEGIIIVRTSKLNEQLLITIKDNGEGIAPEYLPRIMEPFFTTKEPGKGTGLGLYICQGIIQDHKGNITVDSKPGAGTTVSILLPVINN